VIKFKKIKFRVSIKEPLKDLLAIIGIGLLFYGIYLIYPPAAYIALGLGLIYVGVR